MIPCSAAVELELFVAGGFRMRLGKIGPERVYLRETGYRVRVDPGTTAVVSMTVDGRETVWPVRLPNGINPEERAVAIVDIAPDEKTPAQRRAGVVRS